MTCKNILNALLGFVVLYLVLPTKLQAQDHSKALSAADTSRFTPNKKDNWQLYNSYVNSYQKDSAQLELILQYNGTVNLKQEQLVGKIKYQPMQPSTTQTISFNLLSENYLLRIDDKGRCYLKFIDGLMPTANPFIIPLKVYYKL